MSGVSVGNRPEFRVDTPSVDYGRPYFLLEALGRHGRAAGFISHHILITWFYKVNSPIKVYYY